MNSLKQTSRPGRLIVALVALLAALGACACGNKDLPFIVTFKDAHNLKVGQKLLYNGVTIGEVTGVDLDESGTVKVAVKVPKEHKKRVYKEAKFKVESAGGLVNMSGEKVLAVKDRDGPRTPIQPGDIIKGTDSILDDITETIEQYARKAMKLMGEARTTFNKLSKEFQESEEGKALMEFLGDVEKKVREGGKNFQKEHLPALKERLKKIKQNMEEKGTLDKAGELLENIGEVLDP